MSKSMQLDTGLLFKSTDINEIKSLHKQVEEPKIKGVCTMFPKSMLMGKRQFLKNTVI